ncbi:hypothetical protein MHI37_15575 [Paenibacillus sp. FSL H8-0548]|uniref:hypothetical protein n=1 Tax=Paenibacillus sp. FSL H8-0548 TaxID=1920422 RepID=UPI0011815577|nr:hypothetical protein [Paenibacillus sp. FSL H8-0548]
MLGMNSIFQFINIYVNDGLEALGFLFFLSALFAITIFIILLVDLFNKNHRVVRAKYVSKYKNIIYVLKENGQVKKIRIFAPEMLHHFSSHQQVEVTLSAIAQIPMNIIVVETDGN